MLPSSLSTHRPVKRCKYESKWHEPFFFFPSSVQQVSLALLFNAFFYCLSPALSTNVGQSWMACQEYHFCFVRNEFPDIAWSSLL